MHPYRACITYFKRPHWCLFTIMGQKRCQTTMTVTKLAMEMLTAPRKLCSMCVLGRLMVWWWYLILLWLFPKTTEKKLMVCSWVTFPSLVHKSSNYITRITKMSTGTQTTTRGLSNRPSEVPRRLTLWSQDYGLQCVYHWSAKRPRPSPAQVACDWWMPGKGETLL